MKNIKRNTTSISTAISTAYHYDMSYKGFAIDHEKKMLWVMEATDIAIRNGNDELLIKFYEIRNKYPSYNGGVLHCIFLG